MFRPVEHLKHVLQLSATLALLALVSTATADTTPEQVKAFVRQIYIEGVPYAEASQLSADVALPILQQVLDTPRDEDHWANAAVTIGMIGNDRGVPVLTAFITRREATEKLTQAQSVAKTSAVMSLGYILNKTGNRSALEFLQNGADPQTWEERELRWTGAFHGDAAERDRNLATMAVLGLGVSGNPEAARFLESLQAAPTTPRMRALRSAIPDIDTTAAEALNTNRAIAAEGIRSYYLKLQPKHPPDVSRPGVPPHRAPTATEPPVTGAVVKAPAPGEVLREPQPGEVVAPAKVGEVVKPAQAGQRIDSP